MKKFICAVILVILAFVMCSCSDNAENSDGQSTSSSQNVSSDSKDVDKSQTSEYNFSRDDSTVRVNSRLFRCFSDYEHKSLGRNNDDEYWLTSLKISDKQLLSIDIMNEWSYEEHDKNTEEYIRIHETLLENSDSYCIKASEYYTEDSTGYGDLKDEDILFTGNKNYNPVVTKVTYTDYDYSDKQPKDYWIDAFKKELTDYYGKEFYSPIVVRESWSFDYNNQKIEIVTASNVFYDYDGGKLVNRSDVDMNNPVPAVDKNIAYKITRIFADGNIATFNYDYSGFTYIQSIELSLFGFPKNYEPAATGDYYFYQYDENNNISLYPVFLLYDWGFREFQYWNTFIFADIDEDGNPELLYLYQHRPGVGAHDSISAYELEDFYKLSDVETASHQMPKIHCPRIYD